MKEKIIVLEQEKNSKKNIPKTIIIHTNNSFHDIYSKSVVESINLLVQPI